MPTAVAENAGRRRGGSRSSGRPFVFPEKRPDGVKRGFFSSLEVIGQYHRSYILCQEGNDLVLVDQHAAHERIGFEHLKAQYPGGESEPRPCFFPVMLELDFRGAALLQENLDELGRLGFELEPFGGKSFALKAVPRCLGTPRPNGWSGRWRRGWKRRGSAAPAEEALDDVLILMACHGVMRANRASGAPEMAALLRDLDRVDFSAHCPHGRPVMTRLTLGEVERMFKRS